MALKSTARVGAVSITTKTGTRVVMRPTNPALYLARLKYLVDDQAHECDFSPIYDGAPAAVCACGRTCSR